MTNLSSSRKAIWGPKLKPENELPELITADKFSIEVERAVHDGQHDSYIACICEKAELYDIEMASIKPFLTSTLIEKVKHEASSLNLLKEKNTTASLTTLFG